jgi:hypothetical protein
LCQEAEEVVRRIRRKIRFDLEFVDIGGDSQAYSRYWDRVPVVEVDGREVAAAPIDERHLRAPLDS